MRRGSKTLVAALAALLVVLGLGACGGDNSGSTNSTATGAGGQAQSKGGSGDGSGKSGEGKSGGGSGGNAGKVGSAAGLNGFTPKQHDDSGGGSSTVTVKGGDNSVQEFGREGDDAEFEAAAAALHNFLDSRGEGNWEASCRYMAKKVIESFEELAAQAKNIDSSSCGAIVGSLTNPAAKPALKAEAAKADARSLRTDGDRSYLIYTGQGGALLAMPMVKEGGQWKVSNLAPAPLD